MLYVFIYRADRHGYLVHTNGVPAKHDTTPSLPGVMSGIRTSDHSSHHGIVYSCSSIVKWSSRSGHSQSSLACTICLLGFCWGLLQAASPGSGTLACFFCGPLYGGLNHPGCRLCAPQQCCHCRAMVTHMNFIALSAKAIIPTMQPSVTSSRGLLTLQRSPAIWSPQASIDRMASKQMEPPLFLGGGKVLV